MARNDLKDIIVYSQGSLSREERDLQSTESRIFGLFFSLFRDSSFSFLNYAIQCSSTVNAVYLRIDDASRKVILHVGFATKYMAMERFGMIHATMR